MIQPVLEIWDYVGALSTALAPMIPRGAKAMMIRMEAGAIRRFSPRMILLKNFG